MISISTSQTFRSWVVIFHLRQPMEFLSLNLYDTPGLALRMNVLYWGPGDFPVSFSNRDTSRNAWNRHSGSFMADKGDLIQHYEVSLSRMFKWHSDPWPTVTSLPIRLSTNFMTMIPSLTFTDYEFPWSICNGCDMPAGNAYPSGHLVPSPILGLANAPIVWDQILRTCHVFTRLFTSNTPWYFLDFAWRKTVTFQIAIYYGMKLKTYYISMFYLTLLYIVGNVYIVFL